MTLQQLEYVVAVAEHRHFLKAAEACHVTQPTLSAMIQKLEDELGVRIFDRRRKPIALTAAGLLVVEEARSLLAGERRLRARLDEERKVGTGVVRLGVLPTIAPYLIPRVLPRMAKYHPGIDLRITEMKTAPMRTALEHGAVDAALMARSEDWSAFRSITLFYEQYFVYAAPDTPLAQCSSVRTDDLRDAALWLLDEGHCFRDQLVKFCQLKGATHSRSAYRLGSIETFMRLVEGGMGTTFIPELSTLQLSAEQQRLVRPFAVPVPTREVLMVSHPDFVRCSLLDILAAEIRAAVPKDMLRLTHAQRTL